MFELKNIMEVPELPHMTLKSLEIKYRRSKNCSLHQQSNQKSNFLQFEIGIYQGDHDQLVTFRSSSTSLGKPIQTMHQDNLLDLVRPSTRWRWESSTGGPLSSLLDECEPSL